MEACVQQRQAGQLWRLPCRPDTTGRNRHVWNEMPLLALLPAEKSAQGSVHALGAKAERGSRLASQT